MGYDNNRINLVICESDITMALNYLKEHPEAYPNKMPAPFARKRFLDFIREQLNGHKIKCGQTIQLRFNMWGHIGFVGGDLAGYPHETDRLQLYLSIRYADTNPEQLVSLI